MMTELKPSQFCDNDYEILKGKSLPDAYRALSAEELDQRIAEAKSKLGAKVLILGHHYQRDEIIKFADLRGDSLKLAQFAAQNKAAQFIVFCGVHFMAESADILCGEHQRVILPNMEAGCSMADMANIGQVETCWEELTGAGINDIIPITYINSAADLKAFVGKHGGTVCTSSNAPKIVEWALQQNKRVLFFPDQHLGRITALSLGVPLEDMMVWDPFEELGGSDVKSIKSKRVFLWKGHCSVHARFTKEQIEKARRDHPGIQVIVHPECPLDTVQAADEYGSTEYIYNRLKQSPAGSKWAVGTEVNLVHRMAEEMPDKFIMCLDPVVCPCATMYCIHPAYLCWVLEGLVDGKIINQVKVPADIRQWAKVALDTMLGMK